MEKATVIEIRDLLKDSPIQLTCCDMLTFWDNVDKFKYHQNIEYPNIIWNDEKEYFIALKPYNDGVEHYQFPVEVTIVPYENIEYIKSCTDIKSAREVLSYYKADESIKKSAEDMFGKITTPKHFKTTLTSIEQTK